jgi:hypothetical protein
MKNNQESLNTLKEYLTILRKLLRISQELQKTLMEHPQNDAVKTIILSFLAKANHSLEAIILLYKHSLFHEAQSLIRIIFELFITFSSFVKILQANPKEACWRVWDCVMLEKVKQQRASDFKGLDLVPGAPTPQELLETEKNITSRYSESELKKIRRYGFSGLNVEQRAQQAGFSDLYDIVYRNFSRNVHSTDFMELTLLHNPNMIERVRFSDYTESRDFIGCEVTFISAVGLAGTIDDIFQLNFDRRFIYVNKLREKLKQSKRLGA